MDQKLQNLLYSLPTRTAWIIAGSCAAFWLLCLTGVLTPPISAPPNITLFWFYAMLMLVLASGLAVIGAAAVLVLKRGGRAGPGAHAHMPAAAAGPAAATATPGPGSVPGAESVRAPGRIPAETDDGGADQLAGLSRILDDPGNLAGREAQVAAASAPAPEPAASEPAPSPGSPAPRRPAQVQAATKRKRRKRR